MTVDLTPETEQKLHDLALQTERTPEELAQEAVENYISYQRRFTFAVREGLAAADRGELHESDDVLAMMDDILANG